MANFITDLVNAAVVSELFKPQNITATTNGTGADFQGANVRNQEFAICQAGVIDGVYVIKIQESSDNSTFTDIVGATVTYPATDDNLVKIIPFYRQLRYIRAVATATTAGTGNLFAVVGVSQKVRTGGDSVTP